MKSAPSMSADLSKTQKRSSRNALARASAIALFCIAFSQGGWPSSNFPFIVKSIAKYGQNMGVTLTPETRDGGFDILAVHRNMLTWDSVNLVECKRYGPESGHGIGVVQRLLGAVVQQRAAKGLVVTTSFFTRKCYCHRWGEQVRNLFEGPKGVVDLDRLAYRILTTADLPFLSLLHFRQCLSSNLHFRQFNGSKTRIVDQVGIEKFWFWLNLRQLIGSSGGKELVQVTIIL